MSRFLLFKYSSRIFYKCRLFFLTLVWLGNIYGRKFNFLLLIFIEKCCSEYGNVFFFCAWGEKIQSLLHGSFRRVQIYRPDNESHLLTSLDPCIYFITVITCGSCCYCRNYLP